MEFNSFDMDIQSDEFAKEYENWLESLDEEDWFESIDNTFDFDFDYDQWIKDCEEALWYIGEEETKLFG